jgi:transmembrane sensor
MTRQDIRTLMEKYLKGGITREEAEKLNSWYRSENEKEIHWEVGSVEEAEDLSRKMLKSIKDGIHPEKPRRVLRFEKNWLRMAASVSLVVLFGWLAYKMSGKQKQEYVTISSPVGKVTRIVLPDSSLVWLNTGSELKYVKDFSTSRDVELNGEAFFDVKPNSKSPFYVHSGMLLTKVLGTAFAVKAFPDAKWMVVAVERGKVQVNKGNDMLAVLLPEQQIEYNVKSGEVVSSNISGDRNFAWKEGKLEFHEQTLAEITAQLERWYQVKFKFSDENLKNCVYTASFDNSIKINELLAVLCEINNIGFELDQNGRVVKLIGKGCS